MRLATSIFLSVLFVSANVKAELNEICQIKNEYIGKCSYLKHCPYYNNMIQYSKLLNLKPDDIFKILWKINCGFVGADVLVCCPPDSSNQALTPLLYNAAGNTDLPSPMTRTPVTFISPLPPWTTISTTTSTIAPIMGSPPGYDFSNSSTTLTDKPTTLTGKTTATTPHIPTAESTIEELDIEKFKRLLPEECGRILIFKYFHGNRTEFDDFPWTTLVAYETPTGKLFGCGGVLINSRYVLTAAHCVTGLPPSWKVSSVRFGEYDTDTEEDCLPDGPNYVICNTEPLDIVVEKVIAHPGFQPVDASRLHDIALIRMAIPIDFTNTRKPICLPTKNPFPQTYFTSGWGKDLVKNSIRSSTNLKYMSYISLIDQNNCQTKYTEDGVRISQSHICGGTLPVQKPCVGDGGGPLMGFEEIPSLQKRVAAFGVLSLNKLATEECRSGNPAVYTKVLDYMNWILDNLKE